MIDQIKDFGLLIGFAISIYEAQKFAKSALALAEEAKGVALATNTAITEMRIVTERLVVITEGLDRRIQLLENDDYQITTTGFLIPDPDEMD